MSEKKTVSFFLDASIIAFFLPEKIDSYTWGDKYFESLDANASIFLCAFTLSVMSDTVHNTSSSSATGSPAIRNQISSPFFLLKDQSIFTFFYFLLD